MLSHLECVERRAKTLEYDMGPCEDHAQIMNASACGLTYCRLDLHCQLFRTRKKLWCNRCPTTMIDTAGQRSFCHLPTFR